MTEEIEKRLFSELTDSDILQPVTTLNVEERVGNKWELTMTRL